MHFSNSGGLQAASILGSASEVRFYRSCSFVFFIFSPLIFAGFFSLSLLGRGHEIFFFHTESFFAKAFHGAPAFWKPAARLQ